MHRRDFLRLSAAAAAGVFLPDLLMRNLLAAGEAPATTALPASFDWDRTLILIELRGGNDGLNTVVPFSDPSYYRVRPKLAVPADKALKLNDKFGLNPVMGTLMPAWKEGDLAIILGVGYANPNRSHFRGIDIWHGATKFDEMSRDGWVARIIDKVSATAPSDQLADGIVFGYSDTVGYQGYGPLFGHELRNIIMNSPDEFIKRAKRVEKVVEKDTNTALSHILGVQDDINKTADRMAALQRKAPAMQAKFPGSGLAQQLEMTGRLLAAGAKVPVFKLTLDGFDTHAGQIYRHEQLTRTLAEAVAPFRESMKAAGLWDKIVLMTYSEFGRRVSENDSGGTDHGTAAPHFMMGGKVKGGFHGTQPSLDQLDNGDLNYSTDFRSLYATIAQEWWGYKEPFLSEKKVKSLGLIKA
jgi:uncharacterized protein (DUF1501 family)